MALAAPGAPVARVFTSPKAVAAQEVIRGPEAPGDFLVFAVVQLTEHLVLVVAAVAVAAAVAVLQLGPTAAPVVAVLEFLVLAVAARVDLKERLMLFRTAVLADLEVLLVAPANRC
jgi:hypothetical protein